MMEPTIPEAGEIWEAFLDPTVGREQGGRLPVLVVSTDVFNQLLHQLCFVAPITSRDRDLITQVRIAAPNGGLSVDSVIMCDQTRAISILRLKRKLGQVDEVTLERARREVARFIGK